MNSKERAGSPEVALVERSRRGGQFCCDALPELRFSVQEAERIARMAKAIANPVRLQIVELLSRFGGQVCACDIEAKFELSQPTISHHLKVLRTAGLVDCERRGLWAFYFARPDGIEQLRELFAELG